MAMRVISSVPPIIGMIPKEGGLPVGAHSVPNRNCQNGTSRKKSRLSYTTDRTMPMVVSTATAEATASSASTTRSVYMRVMSFGAKDGAESLAVMVMGCRSCRSGNKTKGRPGTSAAPPPGKGEVLHHLVGCERRHVLGDVSGSTGLVGR
jgi:hypothetical protein